MDKIKVLSLAALCLGFVACDVVEESTSTPQTWPQETIFSANDLTVSTLVDAPALDLKALNANREMAKVATFSVKDFPETSALQLVMQIAKDEEFAEVVELPTTLDEEGNVEVSPDAVNGAYNKLVSKEPVESVAMSVRFIANAVNGKEVIRIGGPDVYYGDGAIKFKPFYGKVIESNYYFVSTLGDMQIAQALPFMHSDENVYDDPIFTCKFDIDSEVAEAGGIKWYIVPASSFAVGEALEAFVPEEAEAVEGALVSGEAAAAGTVAIAGPVLITINMDKMTYSFQNAIEHLYVVSSMFGLTKPAASPALYTYDYKTYQGLAPIKSSLKFWSDTNGDKAIKFGVGEEEGTIDPKGGYIRGFEEGLYWAVVNLNTLTYKLNHIQSLGLVGSFNGWGGEPDAVLTHDAKYQIWEGTVDLAEGDEWKIRADEAWAINFGGTYDDVTFDGANFKCEESGKYKVTFIISELPYSVNVVKLDEVDM